MFIFAGNILENGSENLAGSVKHESKID